MRRHAGDHEQRFGGLAPTHIYRWWIQILYDRFLLNREVLFGIERLASNRGIIVIGIFESWIAFDHQGRELGEYDMDIVILD